MIVAYVATNFVLELALLQEQYEYCQKIMAMCEMGTVKLAVPVFCVAESYETLVRRAKKRAQTSNDLAEELQQLSRSEPYKSEIDTYWSITGLLLRSSQEEELRLGGTLERILKIADVISLDAAIIGGAAQNRVKFNLEAQDSIVYTSVLRHRVSTTEYESCFIDRDHHFNDPDIEESLSKSHCKLLFSFERGFNYIDHRINASGS